MKINHNKIKNQTTMMSGMSFKNLEYRSVYNELKKNSVYNNIL